MRSLAIAAAVSASGVAAGWRRIRAWRQPALETLAPALCAVALAGCGQKGPLRLPAPLAAAAPPASAASATAPAGFPSPAASQNPNR